MTRHIDRARGILNLILIISCFAFYAGFLIKEEATILNLFDEFKSIVNQEAGGGSISISAGEVKFSEVIDILDTVTDLTWLEGDEVGQYVSAAIGMQGQNPELSDWLEDQYDDNISGIEADRLPKEFFSLFEEDERTLTARRLSAQMKEKYYALKSVVGDTGSVLDFYKSEDPKIKLYGLNVPLSASKSLVVMVVISGILSSYLLSLLGAIDYEIRHLDEREGTDLVLFHPGKLSLVISLLWMFLPVIVAVYNYYTVENLDLIYFLCAGVVAVVIFVAYLKAIRCRRLLFEKLAVL